MNVEKNITRIREIDELHLRNTALTRRHPMAHFVTTFTFIMIVLSFGKYEIDRLFCLIVYPVTVMIIGEIPIRVIIGRILCVLPFVGLIGLLNPFLDSNKAEIGKILISAGWISFAVTIFKCVLTVSAGVLLVCFVGIDGITEVLHILRLPQILIIQLSFTYRYIHVLGEETVLVWTSYKLRAPKQKGIALRDFGALCGSLFLRSLKRADSIYAAMRCRGFNGSMPTIRTRKPFLVDYLYGIAWIVFFVIIRIYNLPLMLGGTQ